MKSALPLTQQQANAFTLRQQHLTQSTRPPLETMRKLVGIQAQYPTGFPISLWARSPILGQDWVHRALYETRILVKTWCLRGTIHVLASADLSLLVQAIGQQQACEYAYFMKTRRALDQEEIQALNQASLIALEDHPLSRSELHRAVPQLANIAGSSWGLDVKGLAFSGELVLADPVGNETRFARRDRWLSGFPWEFRSEGEARRELLYRFLTGYGPATRQDFAHWSGLKMKIVKDIFDICGPDLIQVDIAKWQREYYILRQDEPLLRTDLEAPTEVILLPKFDPLLMGYQDRIRFVAEEDLSKVFRPAAQVEAVALFHGRAAATWRASLHGSRLIFTIIPFRHLVKDEIALLCTKAEQLTTFLGGKVLNLTFTT